ncbi:hypothetical protein MMC10_010879 [Thelotrema lepadinum]|nr:hypothetical protein [Thelotrema lepadinum]
MEKFTKAITVESVASKSSKSTGFSMATTFASSVDKVPDLRIRAVAPSEYKAAARCLADAFSLDDLANYFTDCPDTTSWNNERKWALHVKILEVMTYAHTKCGLVQAIGDPKNGGTFDSVSLWMPPGTVMDGFWTIVRRGLWRHWAQLSLKLSKEGRVRFFKEFLPLLHSTKIDVLKDRDPNSWYLVYLGTHSRARGRGLAKRLVGEVTRKADLESRACYLESSNEVNIPLYQKLGFETTKQIQLHRGRKTVALDIMVREPIQKQSPVLTPPKETKEPEPSEVDT